MRYTYIRVYGKHSIGDVLIADPADPIAKKLSEAGVIEANEPIEAPKAPTKKKVTKKKTTKGK